MQEKYTLATLPKRGSKDRRHEYGGLPDEVEPIAMGMVVTFNVSTDLDIGNGARGHIVDIVLGEKEEAADKRANVCDCSTLSLHAGVNESHQSHSIGRPGTGGFSSSPADKNVQCHDREQ